MQIKLIFTGIVWTQPRFESEGCWNCHSLWPLPLSTPATLVRSLTVFRGLWIDLNHSLILYLTLLQFAYICAIFFQGAAYSNQGPVQPYGSHAPSHVTSLPYQPSQLSQGHGPPQAPLQPPTNSHQGFANQQQVLPQIPYQQISYQQGVPGAPPEYPSQSAPQDYSSQYFTQASMASYPNFPAQPQMVYSQQPLL